MSDPFQEGAGCGSVRRRRLGRDFQGDKVGVPPQALVVGRVQRLDEFRLAQQGAEPAPDSPDQFAALIRSEISKYAKIVKQSGAKVD